MEFLFNATVSDDYKAGYRAGWDARERAISEPEPACIEAQKIAGAVCGYFQTGMGALASKSRKRETAYPRQVCMWLLKKYSGLPLKIIGEMFGGRDHTTVIHSCEVIESLLFSRPETRNDARALEKIIRIRDSKAIELTH